MIDLHTHSTASDGVFSPSELVNYAVQQGLTTIALTDHNGIEGVLEAEIAAHKQGIGFIRGVEFSAQNQTHIVGLFLDDLLPIHETSMARGVILKKNLADLGYEIDDTVASMRDTRKRCIADLIAAGKAKDKQEAIQKYLLPPYEIQEAIDLIHACGGIAILGHPVRYERTIQDVEHLIETLKPLGLDGMECYQSLQTTAQTEALLKLAAKHDLVISGGSDFHGPDCPRRALGHYGKIENQGVIPDELIIALALRVKKIKKDLP